MPDYDNENAKKKKKDNESSGGSSSAELANSPRMQQNEKAPESKSAKKIAPGLEEGELAGPADFIDNLKDTMSDIPSIAKILSTVMQGTSIASSVEKGVSGDDGIGNKVTTWLAGFSAGFSTMANTAKTMKALLDEDNDRNKKEKMAAVADGALNTAKSYMKSVEKFYMLSEKAPAGITASIPAISIAISILNFIKKGYHYILSKSNVKNMRKVGRVLLDKITAQGYSEGFIQETVKKREKIDAEIAVYEKTLESSEKRQEEQSTAKWYKIKSKREASLEKHKLRQADIKKSILQKENEKKRLSKIIPEDMVEEYELARELHLINEKRINRDKLLLATESLKLAGSIVTLSGVGASVGTGLTAAAKLVELGASGVRKAKQHKKDKSATKAAKGNGDFDDSVVKSSEAKKARSLKQISAIINLCKKPDAKQNADQIVTYLKATGVHTNILFKKQSGDEQVQMIYEAMKNREFK